MAQRFFRDLLATEHAADLAGAGRRIQLADDRHGAAILLTLLDEIMMSGEPRDLREMRDAEHLARGREKLKPAADHFGRASADGTCHAGRRLEVEIPRGMLALSPVRSDKGKGIGVLLVAYRYQRKDALRRGRRAP